MARYAEEIATRVVSFKQKSKRMHQEFDIREKLVYHDIKDC